MSFPENRNAKPPYSYAALICLALATSQQRMTLNQIYNWVRAKFAFFRFGDQSWTVSFTFYIREMYNNSFAWISSIIYLIELIIYFEK